MTEHKHLTHAKQIERGIEKGLADVKAGRFIPFDRKAAKALLSEIKSAS